jgi:hypothetical protein
MLAVAILALAAPAAARADVLTIRGYRAPGTPQRYDRVQVRRLGSAHARYPLRLTIDVGAAGSLTRTAAARFLRLPLRQRRQVDVPYYVFATSLGGRPLIAVAKRFLRRSRIRRLEFRRREPQLWPPRPDARRAGAQRVPEDGHPVAAPDPLTPSRAASTSRRRSTSPRMPATASSKRNASASSGSAARTSTSPMSAARAEPAVDGGPPEAQLRRDRLHVDAPAAQPAAGEGQERQAIYDTPAYDFSWVPNQAFPATLRDDAHGLSADDGRPGEYSYVAIDRSPD